MSSVSISVISVIHSSCLISDFFYFYSPVKTTLATPPAHLTWRRSAWSRQLQWQWPAVGASGAPQGLEWLQCTQKHNQTLKVYETSSLCSEIEDRQLVHLGIALACIHHRGSNEKRNTCSFDCCHITTHNRLALHVSDIAPSPTLLPLSEWESVRKTWDC